MQKHGYLNLVESKIIVEDIYHDKSCAKSQSCSTHAHLFSSIVLPAILYASETWSRKNPQWLQRQELWNHPCWVYSSLANAKQGNSGASQCDEDDRGVSKAEDSPGWTCCMIQRKQVNQNNYRMLYECPERTILKIFTMMGRGNCQAILSNSEKKSNIKIEYNWAKGQQNDSGSFKRKKLLRNNQAETTHTHTHTHIHTHTHTYTHTHTQRERGREREREREREKPKITVSWIKNHFKKRPIISITYQIYSKAHTYTYTHKHINTHNNPK